MRHALPGLALLAGMLIAGSTAAQYRSEYHGADGGWGRFVEASEASDAGHASEGAEPREHLDAAAHEALWATIQDNIRRLGLERRLPELKADPSVRFAWPTRFAAGRPEFLDHTVSNYIDHNPAPNAVRDFSCGTRSYDTAAVGGGHKGTDIGVGQRGFYKMDTEQVVVVAAAPGVIVARDDSNPDRSCGDLNALFSNPAIRNNVISVRHADGTMAIYYHVKAGSLTAKTIGDTVVEGEYLGAIGSSGYSSAPHLHFELRSAQNAVIDPWAGACNPTTSVSLWKDQESYLVKEILALMPSSTVPVASTLTPTCTANIAAAKPAADYVQQDLYAQAGVPHQFIAYFRDRETGDEVTFTLHRPDGTEFSSTTFTFAGFASNAFAYLTRTIPATEPGGRWTFAATYAGKTKTTPFFFNVSQPSARVYEFYHPGLDHYFRTASAAEAESLTPDSGFSATGDDFVALDRGVTLPGVAPVCRFYGSVDPGPNSHFYTADPSECAGLRGLQEQIPASSPRWNYEETAFAAWLPVSGTCPLEAPFPVYRLYNRHAGETIAARREDSNHRFTTLSSVYYRMVASGWSGEGIVMCAGAKP